MPNPKWNKKTICTYISQEQKKVWEDNAIRECKGLADFIRNRVDSTINNKYLSGKYCLWLEIPEELHNRALNEFNDGRSFQRLFACRIMTCQKSGDGR